MNKTSEPATKSSVERGLLPVVLLSLALVVAAVPALNVALPNLAADTDASLSQLQWIVDAYALVFAGLLLPAGALGDRYGRKPVLIIGLAVFALGSAAAVVDRRPRRADGPARSDGRGRRAGHADHAVDHHVVVPGRAAGPGRRRLGRRRRRRRRLRPARLRRRSWRCGTGSRCSCSTRSWPRSWRSPRSGWCPTPSCRDPPRVDYVGGLLSVVALAGLVFGAIEGPGRGWGDPVTLTAFGAGVVGLALWVAWGFIADEPLLDPRLFRNRALLHRCLLDHPAVLRVLRLRLRDRPVPPAGARLLAPPGRARPRSHGDGLGAVSPAACRTSWRR